MNESISELARELRELKMRQMDISHKIAVQLETMSFREAYELGLIRLNFPAPPGFTGAYRTKR